MDSSVASHRMPARINSAHPIKRKPSSKPHKELKNLLVQGVSQGKVY